ncbi:MAG: hypothetical protein JO152_00330 [Mycobacteriaceae bacterium]|nr:hypothetical protein [Mycobacteriaceae bacterium]
MTAVLVLGVVGWLLLLLFWWAHRSAERHRQRTQPESIPAAVDEVELLREQPKPKPRKRKREPPERVRHVTPAGKARQRRQRRDTERFAQGVSATSRHAQALGLFDGASGLTQRGVPWGPYVSTTGEHCYDPFELYEAGEIQDPDMVVWGRKGMRKSTAMKVMCRRQWACGKHILVIDPWGEYKALCEDVGGTFINVRPGGGVCLNPLAAADDRHELLQAVARAALPRPLTSREPAALGACLDELVARHPGEEPTLPGVIGLLSAPPPAVCQRLHATAAKLKEEMRDLALGMLPLTEGDLQGMFDGPTSEHIDLENRFIVVSLRELMGSASLGVMLACATAFMQATSDRFEREAKARGVTQPKTILLIDEAWRIFEVPGIAEWLQISVKQSRKTGKQHIIVMHRLSDLDAAGDDGSRTVKLIRGLMEDMSTFVYFRIEADELDRVAETMHLSSSEKEVLKELQPGESLHKIAGAPFVVQTRVHPNELPLVKTDQAMSVGV